MFKKAVLLFFSLSLIFGTFLPQGKGMAAGPEKTVTISAPTVNVREGPSLSYPPIKQIKKGEKYPVLEEQGDWFLISLKDGNTGWVANWLVTENNSPTASVDNGTNAVANTDQLRVRSGPGTSFQIIGFLNKGQTVTIVDQNENWYEVLFSNKKGWVSSDYLDFQANSTSNSVKINSNVQGTVTADALSVRSNPSLNAGVIGSANKGQSFLILAENNNWDKIEYRSGQYGWVADWYLDKNIQTTPTVQSNGPNSITILQDGTNIRKQPNVQSNVVDLANEGDTFVVTSVENNWYQIKLKNGTKGYVAGWIVSVAGNMQPIEKQGAQDSLKNKIIVIDPGHGGNDNGTTGQEGTLEKNLTLRTAKLLYDKLSAAGADVYLTRTDDTYVSLPSRVSVANSLKADAFISLHYDSSPDHTAQGTTGYYYHSYQKQLAETVHSSMVSQTGLKDRGVRFGDFHVIRENNQKATLIELGYLSNPNEEITLNTSQFQENASTGIFDGLANYFSGN